MLPGLTTAAIALAALAPHLPVTTTKYKVTQRLEQEIDATSLGGGKQSMVIKTTSFLTVTLTDSASGRALRVVVDSVQPDSLPPMLPADSLKAAAKGLVFTGFIDAAGKVQNVKAQGDTKLQGLQLESMVRDMWPQLKSGLKVGDAWTDTTTSTNAIGGGDMTTRAITNYKASGTEKVGSATATRLDATSTSQLAGSQAAGGGTADIEGTSTGTGYFLVGPGGQLLGGANSSTSNLTITLIGPQSGSIPVTIKQTSTTTVLP